MSCICKIPDIALKRTDFISEIPGGDIDCVNLAFTLSEEAYPGSLEVLVDGNHLEPVEFTINPDNKGFVLNLFPNNPNLRSSAPRKSEFLRVKYIRAKKDSCLVYL
jgi:hypothetical protein